MYSPSFIEQYNNKGVMHKHSERGKQMDNVTTTVVESAQEYSNDIEYYVDLIHTYGASTVIIAVFIVVLLAILSYILRNNQKTNNQIIKQQQELVDLLLSTKKEDKEENSSKQQPNIVKEPDIVQVFLTINSSIKEILKDISDEIDSSRTAVYVFHNGVYSSHGLPFFKTSCVCEVIKKNCGVTKSINSHNGLQLQMFDNSISYIYKNGKISICDTDDDNNEFVHDSPVLIGMFKNNNIKSASGISIYDHDNNIVGILLTEFTEVHDEDFLTNIENILIEKAPLLSPILEYSGIYDTTNK